MASKFQLDDRANNGFEDASSYDKYRPSYPEEAVGKLLEHLGLSGVKGARVIDLASGTGKFTECKFQSQTLDTRLRSFMIQACFKN